MTDIVNLSHEPSYHPQLFSPILSAYSAVVSIDISIAIVTCVLPLHTVARR